MNMGVSSRGRSMWKKVLIGVAVVAMGYGAHAEDGKVDVKDEVCYPPESKGILSGSNRFIDWKR